MDAHSLAILFHVILFAYWLGGDIGVFYSSGFVIDPDLGRETRLTAAKIMLNLDFIPRICMSLMLTVGGVLSEFVGYEHPTWQMIGIVLLGPVWLSMVVYLHLNEGTEAAKKLTKVDFWFRWAMVLGICASVTRAWMSGELQAYPWIGGKLLLFAFMVFCGLMIRIGLKPFGAAFHKLITDSMTPEDNTAMAKSLNGVKPWVIGIWIALVLEALLGIAQPGPEAESAAATAPQVSLIENQSAG